MLLFWYFRDGCLGSLPMNNSKPAKLHLIKIIYWYVHFIKVKNSNITVKMILSHFEKVRQIFPHWPIVSWMPQLFGQMQLALFVLFAPVVYNQFWYRFCSYVCHKLQQCMSDNDNYFTLTTKLINFHHKRIKKGKKSLHGIFSFFQIQFEKLASHS